MMQSVKRGVSSLTKLSRSYWTGKEAGLIRLAGAGATPAPFRSYSSSLGMSRSIMFPQAKRLELIAGARGAHDQRTKGDEELLGFLSEEISTEKKLQRTNTLPNNIEGFTVKLEKSEVTMTKKHGNEEISISANVNHSVDADFQEDPNLKQQQQGSKDGADEMKSRPNFDVEIKRGNSVISFTCSFIQATPEVDSQEEFNDLFAIDEVCMYDNEWEDKEYSVAGDILDGYLYDLFMNMLEERGVTNEVVDKFSDLCTDYEHSLYVNMLVKLQQFLEKK